MGTIEAGHFEIRESVMMIDSLNLFSGESALHTAIETGAFFLEFQPQLDIASGLPCGVEALIRWNHPRRGKVLPSEFIRIAEETGQINRIGKWVLYESCRAAIKWRHDRFNIPVSVNVSARQFVHPDFLSVVRDALRESGLPPGGLEIEITESVMTDNIQSVIVIMNTLREMGVLLSIDDFGTGFSSLSYVRQMPITQLKIDKAFLRDIDFDSRSTIIAEHIISLGRQLHLDVIAEGVETSMQLCALRMMNCCKIQGFLYARPMSLELLLEFFNGTKTAKEEQRNCMLHNLF